jgi:hypothetical protein
MGNGSCKEKKIVLATIKKKKVKQSVIEKLKR